MKNIKTIEEYNKKYLNRKEHLLVIKKSYVEEFDKKHKEGINGVKNYLLVGKKWCLIDEKYHQIPRPISLTWFRNLKKSVQITTCALLGLGAASAIGLPLYFEFRLVAPQSIEIIGNNVAYSNAKYKLSATFTGPGRINKDVTWKSSNEEVASIDEKGVLTTKKWDEDEDTKLIEITATSNANKEVTASFLINVFKAEGLTIDQFRDGLLAKESAIIQRIRTEGKQTSEGYTLDLEGRIIDEDSYILNWNKKKNYIKAGKYNLNVDTSNRYYSFMNVTGDSFAKSIPVRNAYKIKDYYEQLKIDESTGYISDLFFTCFDYKYDQLDFYGYYTYYVNNKNKSCIEYIMFDKDGYLCNLVEATDNIIQRKLSILPKLV